MIDVKKIRENLINGSLNIDDLMDLQYDLNVKRKDLLGDKILTNEQFLELRDLLMIYLDFYTYSSDGEVLITDPTYDTLMNHYIANGGELISKADKLNNQTQWEFVKHEYPGIVGTIKKVYSFDELALYMNKYRSFTSVRKYRIAPKFDGISSAIKIDHNGKILMGVTRNNGIEGQNITRVIREASNAKEVSSYYASKLKPGEFAWVKTELCVSTENFNLLIEEKEYKNRRSATSGIVNSPKNIDLAKYITIIPLAAHLTSNDTIEYVPLDSKVVTVDNPYDLMGDVETLLGRIRDAQYPFRTDGVVIYPLGDDILPNFDDIMDDAIAYKVNTAKALSPVEYGYVSVGRLGYAIPMLKVMPVEVNETTVTDVSLGSFDKFANMDIHEGEQVEIFSAGDVIPQARIPEHRHYKENASLLKIKKICPYCNEKLTRTANATYRCENKDCFRVKSGKIANFIIKLKAENVSDKTIDDLMEQGLIKTIPDLFTLTEDEIKVLPGYGEDSAKIIINEINKIRTREIPVSSLLGALGITGISEKKCQKLFKVMTLKEMLKTKKEKLMYELLNAEGTGIATAETFANFIHDNKSLINTLIDSMNIVTDINWKGNVVFTGFRDDELEKTLNALHYEVSNNVNSKTIAVVDASYNHDSTKCKAARKKNIDILHKSEINELLKELKKGK